MVLARGLQSRASVTTAQPVMPLKIKANPPACELWEAFDYKPLTGELIRRSNNRACETLQLGYAHVYFKNKKMEAVAFCLDLGHRQGHRQSAGPHQPTA